MIVAKRKIIYSRKSRTEIFSSSPFKRNNAEIKYNVINSVLVGVLVLLGAMSNGDITLGSLKIAFISCGIVAFMKFKDYWQGQEAEYKTPPKVPPKMLFTFLPL